MKKGQIKVKRGQVFLSFQVKYIGDAEIEEGNSWSCEVMVHKDKQDDVLDESMEHHSNKAELLFSRLDVCSKKIAHGDSKKVDSSELVIDIEEQYDYSTVFLKITGSRGEKTYEDLIEL